MKYTCIDSFHRFVLKFEDNILMLFVYKRSTGRLVMFNTFILDDDTYVELRRYLGDELYLTPVVDTICCKVDQYVKSKENLGYYSNIT